MSEPGGKDKLERRSSKSRLAKQDEVVDEEEDNSPSSEASDATIVPAAGSDTPVVHTPGGSPESNSPEDHNSKKLESQRSTDSEKNSPTQGGNPKVKLLVRSHALCDDASPPPEDHSHLVAVSGTAAGSTVTSTLQVDRLSPIPQRSGRPKLEKDGSQSSMSESGASPCLSRDSSVEYTDSTGVDLEEFIKMTLNKNPKDRMMLLKLEQDLANFIKESKHEFLKFPQMSSYHRMLVHRTAAFFGLDHNVDQSGKCVIVNRASNTRLPDFKFSEHVRDEGSLEDLPKKQILKRESASFEEGRSPDRLSLDGKKSKSFEEREEEYIKVRDRIFNQDSTSSQEGMVESPGSQQNVCWSRSNKDEMRWTSDGRPWSSTDSSGYSTDTSSKPRGHVTKASSFGGVTVLTRSDSRTSSLGSRLSKTDSISSGVSSLGSPMTRPPPIPSSPPLDCYSGNHLSVSPSQTHGQLSQSSRQEGESSQPSGLPFSVDPNQPLAVWVASTLDVIPPGSIIINPETGQPYLNPDGSVYRYQGVPTPAPVQISAPRPPPPQIITPGQQQPCLHPPSSQPPPAPPTAMPPAPVPQPQQQQQVYTQYYRQDIKTQESGGGDPSQQFSQMTLQHQSSTESLPEQSVPVPPAPTCGVYRVQSPPQGSVPHSMGVSQQQQQQQQQQQPYMQTQPVEQVQYYTSPAAGTQPMRYMYPSMPYGSQGQLTAQGSMEGQGQGQGSSGNGCAPAAPQNGQYGTQYTPGYAGYPVMGYTTSVPSEPYPQQTYQPGTPMSGYSLPQPVPASMEGGSAGYPPYSGTMSVAGQGYPTTAMVTSSAVNYPGGVTYYTGAPPPQGPQMGAVAAGATNSGQNSGPPPPYRPTTPPSQAAAAPAPQYMSYTAYPNVPTSRPQLPTVSYPTPPVHSANQPFSLARPNMQMSMQMQTRTTSPPQGVGAGYPTVAVAPQSQPIKVYNVEQQRVVEGVPSNGLMASVSQGPGPMGKTAAAPGVLPLRPMVATATMPYRAPTPINQGDVRLIGQPLQQLPRLQISTVTRPRMPVPSSQPSSSNSSSSGKSSRGRKAWVRAKDSGSSAHSSTESMESSGSSVTSSILEVIGLPPTIKRADLGTVCGDLLQQGAKLQVLGPGDPTSPSDLTNCTLLAIFDSEASVQRALVSHRSTQYQLRPPTKQYDMSGAEEPS